MSGNELNNDKSTEAFSADEFGGEAYIRKLVAANRINSPQLSLPEVLAWLKAGSSDEMLVQTVNDAYFLRRTLSNAYVTSISMAEKAFSVSVYQYIRNNDSDNSIGAKIARYFGYIWLDATATAGLVGGLYTTSMLRDGEEHSRWNALYPILVGIPGFILKVVLAAIAVVSMPVMIIPATVALVAYAAGFSKAASAIMAPVVAVIGLIATVPLSNINPFIAFKTVFYDSYKCVRRINEINAKVKAGKTLPRELATRNLNQTDNDVSNLTDIHKENVVEIDAHFNIEGGLRTDMITKATKMFSSAYVIKPRLSAWDPRNFARKELVLEIHSADNKKILGTIHTKISGSNNLKLQFTKEADAYTQDILAVGFTKMIQEISHQANSKEPIKLDISNTAVTEERITANIRGLNKGMGVHVDFEDRKRDTTDEDARISDEIEDKKPEAQDEANKDNEISDVESDERSKSSRSRRDALRGDSGFFRDHNKL